MTYVVGIDIGSIFCKAVILKRGTLVSSHIMPSGKNYRETAERVMQTALDKAGLTRQEIAMTLATGYGATVSFANQRVTEISCQARGIRQLFPSVKTTGMSSSSESFAASILIPWASARSAMFRAKRTLQSSSLSWVAR